MKKKYIHLQCPNHLYLVLKSYFAFAESASWMVLCVQKSACWFIFHVVVFFTSKFVISFHNEPCHISYKYFLIYPHQGWIRHAQRHVPWYLNTMAVLNIGLMSEKEPENTGLKLVPAVTSSLNHHCLSCWLLSILCLIDVLYLKRAQMENTENAMISRIIENVLTVDQRCKPWFPVSKPSFHYLPAV